MDDQTTRERILDALREKPRTPSAVAEEFAVARGTALTHVRHISESLDGADEELLVRPPACRDCGFDGFDDPLNVPSRCPECKSEAIEEPAFVVESP
jgi:predicted Zn-ribbon and HTH transcriptional regulator